LRQFSLLRRRPHRAQNGLRGTRFTGIAKGASRLISIDQTNENDFFKLARLF
jgi:hypothetical protein